MTNINFVDSLKKILILLILIFVLLMVLTWTGLIKCSAIPLWCDTYYGIVGQPKILIVHGLDGMGNPYKLESVFVNHLFIGVRPVIRSLENITYSALKSYDLVIVTRAKSMSAKQIKIFYDYVNAGGKLIWTGDAGTFAPSNEKTIENNASTISSNAWIRVLTENNQKQIIEFNKIISADYIGNFCTISSCETGSPSFVGNFKHDEDSKISSGLKPNSQASGDFALVELIDNKTTKTDLTIDYTTSLLNRGTNTSYGKIIPIIIVTGLGENVIYSAYPLEYYFDSDDPEYYTYNTGMNYPSLIVNSYKRILGYK